MSTEKQPRLLLGMHRPEWGEFIAHWQKQKTEPLICPCGAGLSQWNYSHYEINHPETRAHWQAGHFDQTVTISRAEMLRLLQQPPLQTPVAQALAKEDEAPPNSVLLDFLQCKLLTNEYPYARLEFTNGELCSLGAAINQRNGPDPQNPSTIAYLSSPSVRQVIAKAIRQEQERTQINRDKDGCPKHGPKAFVSSCPDCLRTLDPNIVARSIDK